MDNLGWANELVAAPDLETIGSVIHQRLQSYTAVGAPQSERALAERLAFEHQVRHYMARANDRGFAFARQFEFFASRWVDFVIQNRAAEENLGRRDRQEQYERGRADASTAVANGWLPAPAAPPLPVVAAAPATAPVTLSDAVHQTINALVAAEVAKRVPKPPAPTGTAAGGQHAETQAAPTTALRLSQAMALYLTPPGKKRKLKTRGRRDTAAIVKFAVDLLGNPLFDSVTMADWDRLDEAMTDIPLPKGIPDSHRGSLFLRYKFAQEHGWNELSRVTVTTLKERYHYGLGKFLDWAIKERLYLGEKPRFECIDEENTAALPRDAFDDSELIALVSLPLFTGCAGSHRIWKAGRYLVQHHLYWAYLILIFSGMRPGEVGQIRCEDIVTDGLGHWFFDLRPFDARKGRVAVRDLRNLKTNSSGRVVPIYPTLIELGLLDRMHELETIGETRLFPEWEKFTRGDGTVRWSQPITKSWAYIKKNVLKNERADLTLYSLRHLVADWLDSPGIAQRTRDRILGHAGGVPGRYGRKGAPTQEQVNAIEEHAPPVFNQLRKILTTAKQRADNGELIVLKPWCTVRAD